jgi:hypothetical protein
MLSQYEKLMSIDTSPPDIKLTYDEARDQIKNGDIISFFMSHEDSTLHRITTYTTMFFTGSKIYHTGVALWMTSETGIRRLMLVESVGTNRRIVELSHFKDHKMEVHHRPDYVNAEKVEDYLLTNIGFEQYGFWNLIVIGLNEFFGVQKKETDKQVCSEMAAKSWQHGGMEFETTVVSPGRLRNILIAKGIRPSFIINADAG